MTLPELVYTRCREFNHNHDHRFENVFVHSWEADLFSVTKTGYSYEIEVKVSKSDFMADFKKPKHHLFRTIKDGYAILKGSETKYTYDGAARIYAPACELKVLQVNSLTIPNIFYFAMPWDVIKQIRTTDIPDYAGLIHCHADGYKIIKKAPYIHKDKVDPSKLLFDKYYWKYEHLRMENENNKHRLQIARDRIKELEWKSTVI